MPARQRASPGLPERRFTGKLERLFPPGPGVLVGVGDDAAVVRNPSARSVLCCDPVIGGVHFDAGCPPHLVARKAVNRNLADLAAMGAVADFLLVSVVLPTDMPARHRDRLFVGLRDAARAAGCSVVGGDVAVAPSPLVVTVTAIGHLQGRVLLRSAARAGHTLHVTGPLGGSRAGHHLRFVPPLAEGRWLAGQRAVGAAIDVSDGLLVDLHTMLRASDCAGAELFEAALPVSAAARRLADGDGAAAVRHALTDGEDHVLLWSQRPGELAAGGPLTARARRPIGRVLDQPGLWLVRRDGGREHLTAAGFQHDL